VNIQIVHSLIAALLLAGSACQAQPAAQPSTAPASAPGAATKAALVVAPAAAATPPAPSYADAEPLGAAMEGWVYPYPLQRLQFEMQGQVVRMMYMDVAPSGAANGGVVLLMHGKNFGADYWGSTIRALSAAGYRVIAPDQIGFGKSSKPDVRYTFAQLAENTARLLDHLNVPRVAVVANSMGGMLAVHFTRAYPQRVSALVLEDPLGLEDYVKYIPPQQTENLTKLEMAQTPATYRSFLKGYFPNWQPDFERFVEQFARVQQSAEYPRYAKVSALTYQMIYDGPIFDELARLEVPTLLIIGQQDRTVFGRRFAPPEVVKPLGNFPQLGKNAQMAIPGSKLVEFEGVGHVPHLEVPDKFQAALLQFLQQTR